MKSIKELVEQVHATAKEKGWWDQPRNPLEIHMLIVSEIAEATEEARKGHVNYQYTEVSDGSNAKKPAGELIELADAVIRIMDYCGHKGWDLEQAILDKMAYNETRGYRHGGKKY